MRIIRRVGDFLLWCVGVSIILMNKCPGSERAKHTTNGAIMLLAAGTACIAMFFAAVRVFDNAFTAMLLGFGWSIFIFCVNRFLITTIRKRSKALLLGQALIRIGVALLVSVIIATPLELRITRDRVARGREELRLRVLAQDRTALEEATGFTTTTTKLASREKDLHDLAEHIGEDPPGEFFKATMSEAKSCRAELSRFTDRTRLEELPLVRKREEIDNEISGLHSSERLTSLKIERNDISRRIARLHDNVNSKRAQCEQLETAVNQLRSQHEQQLQQQQSLMLAEVQKLSQTQQNTSAKVEKELQTSQAVSEKAFGSNLISDLEGLWYILEESTALRWICAGLSLFLISVDIAATGFKILMPRGPYDAALEAEEAVAIAQYDARVRFYRDADQNVFTEPFKLQQIGLAIEQGLIAYLDVAASFSTRMQELTGEFQRALRQFEREAQRWSVPENAAQIAELLKNLNEMFGQVRTQAMAEFSKRMRQAFQSPVAP